MDSVLNALWLQANYKLVSNIEQVTQQYQRREVGGIAARDTVVGVDTSYSFSQFPNSQPCGIDFSGAVNPKGFTFLHVHPWALDEIQWSCRERQQNGAFSTPKIYHGFASDPYDYNASGQFGQLVVPKLPAGLPAYILDASGITKFNATPDATPTRIDRCGY
jgi:hypothetical protein